MNKRKKVSHASRFSPRAGPIRMDFQSESVTPPLIAQHESQEITQRLRGTCTRSSELLSSSPLIDLEIHTYYSPPST